MATMAKPKALAMPKRLTAVGPDPMPPITAAPQPKNTRAKVPINSAACLFILFPSIPRPKRERAPYSDGPTLRKAHGQAGIRHNHFPHPLAVAFAGPAAIYATPF